MKKLYIVGAGGFGREVAWLVERINSVKAEWSLEGFIDDNATKHGTLEGGIKVLGGCEYFSNYVEDVWVVCAVGSAKIRELIISKLKKYPHVHFATLIDPSVIKSNSIEIGEGTIVCAGTIITVDVQIGSHVIINLDCTIGHDDIIEDYVTLYPSVNVSGNVLVEKGVELGTGAQIIQGKKIGEGTIIGAGAVVIKDLPGECTAVGCPATPVKFHNS